MALFILEWGKQPYKVSFVCCASTMVLILLMFAIALGRDAPPRCVWGSNDSRCNGTKYRWKYPVCSLFQYHNGTPIPCAGIGGYCDSNVTLVPASYHVHVIFPNPECRNCSIRFSKEHEGFTLKLAFELRRAMAEALNYFVFVITGKHPIDPIDPRRAFLDPSYDPCENVYHIDSGAPGPFIYEPCAYEADLFKLPFIGDPWNDPETNLGYPNYAFFLPGDYWLPGLVKMLRSWLLERRRIYGKLPVMFHTNTGCERRDHSDNELTDWVYGHKLKLVVENFHCNDLGCNQECPSKAPPPANCFK